MPHPIPLTEFNTVYFAERYVWQQHGDELLVTAVRLYIPSMHRGAQCFGPYYKWDAVNAATPVLCPAMFAPTHTFTHPSVFLSCNHALVCRCRSGLLSP